MENLFANGTPFWLYFVLALLSVVIHTFTKVAEIEKNTGKKVNFSRWLAKNRFRIILSALVAVGGVFMLSEMGQLNITSALLLGYTGNSLFTKGQKQEGTLKE